MNPGLALFSGIGIGLLVGVLMGTTVEPVVSIVVGALASGLALLLGLNDQHFGNAKALRIGSFGIACIVGSYLGIHVRSHDLLSPPQPGMAEQKAEYIELGFSEREALDFIAYEKFGIRNPAWAISDAAEAAAEQKRKATASQLFGAEVNLGKCGELESTHADLSLRDAVGNYMIAGGVWKSLAISVRDEIGDPHGVPLLLAARDAFCESGKEGTKRIEDADCERMGGLGSDYETTRGNMATLGGFWQRMAGAIDAMEMDDAAKLKGMDVVRENLCRKEI